MGFSRVIVCSTAFALVLLSSASRGQQFVEQREVTFDLDSMPGQQAVEQREVTFDLDSRPVLHKRLQSMIKEKLSEGDAPKQGQPHFSPRSFMPQQYPVQFPLARPSLDNIHAICLHSDHRPRYPDSYFPPSGFGSLKRRASAVNNAESWFSMCCQGNQTWGTDVTLCCATQAWKLSVKSFCEQDTSVKDRIYHCCFKRDERDLLNCFHKDTPNPNYDPTELEPVSPVSTTDSFSFNPNNCQGTVNTPQSMRRNRRKQVKEPLTSPKTDINFPPGRPTADAMESFCHNQKLRPLYTVKCLPGSGYGWLARQAKTINRIEKGFKQCCKKKKDLFNCADQKWREELNKFCGGQKVDFHCCSVGEGPDDRYNCFQNISPDPHYNMTQTNEELSLNKICDTHKIIKKKFPVGFPLKNYVDKCCPLSEADKTNCMEQSLKETSDNVCSTRKATPPAIRRCCRASSEEVAQCITKVLMEAITKANNVSQKKRKRCPLS